MKMKSKGRHHTSSNDSDESDAKAKSSSSSIDSGHSSLFEHHTKKRKRADSSDSDSDSDEQKRSPNCKQKKKEHGKKKRRSLAVAGSVSVPVSTTSEGEIFFKTKRQQQSERNRRPKESAGTEEQYRGGRGDVRRERCCRSDESNVKQERPLVKTEPRSRDRKSRFADTDDTKEYDWGKAVVKTECGKDPAEKEKPSFGLSGKLTADANTINGVVIKYTEPDDAKLPKRRWRLYPFKGDKALPILYIHRQSAFLIGRDKKVVDIALEHPSISKQHAALQYRAVPFTKPDGTQGRRVRPYVIDLESANGTFLNRKKLEPRRYVELLEKDVIKFGFSQREYVLLHEDSKDDAQDDELPPSEATSLLPTS